MAKEIALSKRAKISQAQQYMLLAVLGASLFLGAAISLVMYFIHQISFNASVIAEEDQAIVSYSNTIKGIGICKKPSGEVYTDEELKKCNPDLVEASSVPGTLRSNILENMAANEALNSVPKEDASECINPNTNKNYTYSEMMEIYNSAENSEQRQAASGLIQVCSALRVIPDALPAFKNEEAMLSSLNKIFLISGWEPRTLSPNGISDKTFSVNFSFETDSAIVIKFLDNLERSIREFDIKNATIGIADAGVLELSARVDAYYTTPSTLTETSKVIESGDNKK